MLCAFHVNLGSCAAEDARHRLATQVLEHLLCSRLLHRSIALRAHMLLDRHMHAVCAEVPSDQPCT